MPKYSPNRRLGNLGEDAAVQFLARKGFTVTARNYLKPWGEIDIVAVKGDILHFIEVKTISRENSMAVDADSNGYRPEEQVHPAKLQKLVKTVETYINETGDPREYQIDAIAVYLDVERRIARCRHYEQIL